MSDSTPRTSPHVWARTMVARRPDEEHRTATNLELFFDLCFVVAVAAAGAGLHHQISDGHVAHGVFGYVLVFFAIWWAWMNFTWFASAYDTDDIAYRLTTLVQIAGALVFAAGVPRALDQRDFAVVTFGYVIMRLAMVTQWLRAAAADPLRRSVCLRYAAGITAVQVCWVLRLALPDGWALAGFFVLVAAELAIPIWAERPEPTTWHPAHIAERYGLFTIIVLGESVLAATVALQSALDGDADLRDLASLAVGGLLTVFAMWWLYFSKDPARFLTSMRAALRWGYGHYFVFSSAAAVGAGLAVNVDVAVGDTTIGTTTAAAAVTVPVAIFLLSLWLLQWVPLHVGRWHNALPPIAVALVLLGTFSGQPVLATGLVLSAVVVFGTLVPIPSAPLLADRS